MDYFSHTSGLLVLIMTGMSPCSVQNFVEPGVELQVVLVGIRELYRLMAKEWER